MDNNERNNGMMNHGKLPPQSIELEESVLGTLILYPDGMLVVENIIDDDYFFKEHHKLIYKKGILPLYNEKNPIDLLTVTDKLKAAGVLESVGGPYYLTRLVSKVGSNDRLQYHALIVKQFAIERQLIRFASSVIADAYDTSVSSLDLLNRAGRDLDNIRMSVSVSPNHMIGDIVSKNYRKIEELCASDLEVTGVPSGYPELDRITGGWQPTDLIIIAGRPGMGKTSVVMNMAENSSVEFKRTIGVFSMEMSKEQLTFRSMASTCNIPVNNMTRGKMQQADWDRLNNGLAKIQNANIIIDEQPALTLQQLRTKARKLKYEHPELEEIIIDYIGLMSGEPGVKGNRESEISTISRGLKQLAKELNVAIVCLCQLGRAVETRGGDKRPMLSDLRDSGAIEQDADVVMFVYRPEYYGIEDDEEGNDLRGKAFLTIAKHRNGGLGEVMLNFNPEICKFTNLNDDTFLADIEGSEELFNGFTDNPDDEEDQF